MTLTLAKTRRDGFLRKIDALQRRITVLHAHALNDLVSLAFNVLSHTGGYAYWSPRIVRQRLEQLKADTALLMGNTLWQLVQDGHAAAVTILVKAYGHRGRKTEAEDDEQQGDSLFPADETDAAIEAMKLTPMNFDDAHAILYSKNEQGLTWVQQLEKSSKRVADPAAMADALAQGIADGDSLTTLRDRIKPLVEDLSVSAQRIARTEGMRIPQTALQKSYDKADAAAGNIVKGMRLHCVMGKNSAPDHKLRNNKFYAKVSPGHFVADDGEYLPQVPYGHPNCLCYSTPEIS